jgi:hypothetical protein
VFSPDLVVQLARPGTPHRLDAAAVLDAGAECPGLQVQQSALVGLANRSAAVGWRSPRYAEATAGLGR